MVDIAEPREQPRVENEEDPFDSLLTLESQYHAEGYALGHADGSRAGRIEGRIFGLEKGFEKFTELGRLHGRADVWQSRLPDEDVNTPKEGQMGLLSGSERLKKHVRRLAELTNVDEVSTENSEDAVQDFEERIRDSRAKALLISRIVGESDDNTAVGPASEGDEKGTRSVRVKKDGTGKSDEMEDFGGLPRAARR